MPLLSPPRALTLAALVAVGAGAGAQSAPDAPTGGLEVSTSLLEGLRARQIGPAVMSGRVSCLAVDPTDAKLMLVGTASGGIWRSSTGGTTVRPVFDDHTQSIGALAFAPSAPDTVYAGTGEPWTRNSVSVGTGMYRSVDRGNSWAPIGLDSTERIARVVVHPADPGVVYVAALGPLWSDGAQRGVFKSTDAGATWRRVLYLNEHTGAADLALDPSDPDVLYAAMWSHRRRPWTFDSGYRGTSGLHKSTDGGETWTEVAGGGWPDGKLGRIAVAVSPSKPEVLYATLETGTDSTRGLYRSADAGATWRRTSDAFGTTVRPFYFARLVVDPLSDSTVYKAGLNASKSDDAGTTIATLDQAMHSDVHDFWVDPTNTDHVLFATDGGVYESFDAGTTARMWMNLPVSQFYHVSVDTAEPYNLYGGLQDNGSWTGPSRQRGGIGNDAWDRTYHGDGFYSFRHPTRPEIIYSELQGGELVRYNSATGQAKGIAPYADAETEELRYNWNSPLLQSTHDPDRIYFAAQYLYRSDDTGDDWTRISPDLTTDDPAKQRQHLSGGLSIDNSDAENHCTIYTIAESPLDADLLYVGTDDGRVQATDDGGATWRDVRAGMAGVPDSTWVTDIDLSPHDPVTAFVTLDNHRRGDMAPYLYRTRDGGQTWDALATPDVEGYALAVKQDLVNPNLLFLGTEFGLYVSMDGGAHWARFANNLPRVAVREIQIHPTAHDLVLATHGRGIAIVDDITPWRELTAEAAAAKLTFLELPPTVLRDPGAGGNWFGGSGNFTGPNASSAARIAYYMPKRHTFGRMVLEVWRDGARLRELPAGKAAGLNVVEMPTARSKPRAAPSDNRSALTGSLFGPNLEAGDYEVRLVKGKDTFTTSFALVNDPDSPYGPEARAAQLELANRLYDQSERLAYVYRVLDELEEAAEALDPADDATAALADSLAVRARRMKGRLTFTGGDFYVDSGEKLREEISNLYLKVSQYPGTPAEPQVAEAARLAAALAAAESEHAALLRERLEPLNAALAAADAQPLSYTTREAFFAEEAGGSTMSGGGEWLRGEGDEMYRHLVGSPLGRNWALGLMLR